MEHKIFDITRPSIQRICMQNNKGRNTVETLNSRKASHNWFSRANFHAFIVRTYFVHHAKDTWKYFMIAHYYLVTSLKIGSCHDSNFIITEGMKVVFCYDNHRWRHLRQIGIMATLSFRCFGAGWGPGDANMTLQWRHNGHDGVSNHQPHDCLLNRLFRCRSKKTSKLRGTGLCVGNSPVTGEFPAQMASNEENVSTWWRHHVTAPSLVRLMAYRMFGTKPWPEPMSSHCQLAY